MKMKTQSSWRAMDDESSEGWKIIRMMCSCERWMQLTGEKELKFML